MDNQKGVSLMKLLRLVSLRVLPILLTLFAIALLVSVKRAQAQTARLTEGERNTIEVFRQASRGVVHINARSAIETRFEDTLPGLPAYLRRAARNSGVGFAAGKTPLNLQDWSL